MSVGQINAAKELTIAYQPLLLAEFYWPDGTVLRCATHGLRAGDGGYQYAGNDYLPRILNQDIAATQMLADHGAAMAPAVTLVLNDADRYLWTNYEQTLGFRGARLVLRFVFWNVGANDFSSDYLTPFVGVCSAPWVDETTLIVRATSLLSMEQTMLPSVRVQKTCPWLFPATRAQREEGANDRNSWFFACGYAPDVEGENARGNLNGSEPFTSCGYTKSDCQARGMYDRDAQNRITGRFGGVQWDPPASFRSRSYLTGKWEEGWNNSNEAKYGDYAPMVYGTAWVEPVVLNVVGDANYTSFECLVCYGEVGDILRVVVNDVEVPPATTITHQPLQVADPIFWWALVNRGDRDGGPAQAPPYNGQGDPYGSLCVIQVTVPRRLADPSGVPRVRVLVRGARVRKYKRITSASVSGGVATITFEGPNEDVASNEPNYRVRVLGNSYSAINGVWGPLTGWTYGPPGTITFSANVPDGSGTGGVLEYYEYSTNPVWILADILSWAGWDYGDLDLDSWIDAAAICDERIGYTDPFGNVAQHERFRASLVLRQRRSVAEIVRGLCNAMRGVLVPSPSGKLALHIKRTLADQQPAPIPGSNHNAPITSKRADGTPANGYVAYHFTPSNIVRRDGRAQITITQRANQDAPNKLSLTFQDEENGWALDSVTVIDTEAVERAGQEVAGAIPVDGICNYDQARRVLSTMLAETHRGNGRGDAGGTIEFEVETTFRGVHLRVGQICLLTFPMLGISQQPVRVTGVQPATNFETARVRLAWHNDDWYLDAWGQTASPAYSGQRRNRYARPPYPVLYSRRQPFEKPDPLWRGERPEYALTSAQNWADQISERMFFRISGKLPVNAFSSTVRPPAVPLQGNTAATGGDLPGGRNYWVALVALDSAGGASPHSALCRVYVPEGTNTNTITVPRIAWSGGTAGYAVFVGEDPYRMFCERVVTGGPLPDSITITSLETGLNHPIPDTEFDRLRVRLKRLALAGVRAYVPTATGSNTITCDGAGWTDDEWAGRVVSFIGYYDGSTEQPPVWSFRVLSNTADTLTVDTANYDPTPAVVSPQSGDQIYMVIRAMATIHSPNTIGDGALAMEPDEYVGRIVRIIAGAGRGQWRRIVGNDATTLTVDRAWDVEPDSSSIWWIEEANWDRVQDITPGEITQFAPSIVPEYLVDVAGLERQPCMISPVAVDGGGAETMESAAHVAIRDFYLFRDTAGMAQGRPGVVLTVQGNLAIASDVAPRISLASDARATGVVAEVKQAPTGAPVTIELYVGATRWLALTIPAGATRAEATPAQIADAAQIPAGANIRLDITSVGTTSPGVDLSVMIYL